MKKGILILTMIISTGAFAMDHSNHANHNSKDMKNSEEVQMMNNEKCQKMVVKDKECEKMETKNEVDHSMHV